MKRTLFLALALLIVAGSAQADVLAASSRQTFTTPVSTSLNYLPLDDAGNTSLNFTTASTQTIVVTYSTDCQVAIDGNAVAVVIYIDGVAAAGTGASSAGSRLCMTDDIAAHSRTAFLTVPAGNHTVQITGQILGSGTGTLRRTVTTVQN
ncbi:MAG TPA: hypothetical protein VGF48_23175 [Thermoanaerobaculia bacterium]|jgi:hypothetical protein